MLGNSYNLSSLFTKAAAAAVFTQIAVQGHEGFSPSLSLYMCVYLVDDEEEYLDELITTGKFYVSGIYKQEREREALFTIPSSFS